MNRTMSCPVFAEGTLLVVEDQCAWARMIFGPHHPDQHDAEQGFTTDTITAQTGVQVEVAPNWFTAFSVAYQEAWTTGAGNSSWTSAYGLDVSAALKYQAGPWLFALAADLGWMNASSSRTISVSKPRPPARRTPTMSPAASASPMTCHSATSTCGPMWTSTSPM